MSANATLAPSAASRFQVKMTTCTSSSIPSSPGPPAPQASVRRKAEHVQTLTVFSGAPQYREFAVIARLLSSRSEREAIAYSREQYAER